MAYIQNTNFDRTRRHVQKRLLTTLKGLQPSKIQGRLNGPLVLSNSIPKSGTHLLEGFLEQFPGIRNAGSKTLSIRSDNELPNILAMLGNMKRGAFYNAHLAWHAEYADIISNNNIRVIFLIRDPRDIVVSRYKYITYIDKLHFAHQFFLNASSDEERLALSISGSGGNFPSIRQILESFSPWLNRENVFVCRYEDLVGARGGGSVETQKETLRKIGDHLEMDSRSAKSDFLSSVILDKSSSTYRKGVIGNWKNEFNEKNLELYRSIVGDLPDTYGYET